MSYDDRGAPSSRNRVFIHALDPLSNGELVRRWPPRVSAKESQNARSRQYGACKRPIAASGAGAVALVTLGVLWSLHEERRPATELTSVAAATPQVELPVSRPSAPPAVPPPAPAPQASAAVAAADATPAPQQARAVSSSPNPAKLKSRARDAASPFGNGQCAATSFSYPACQR